MFIAFDSITSTFLYIPVFFYQNSLVMAFGFHVYIFEMDKVGLFNGS